MLVIQTSLYHETKSFSANNQLFKHRSSITELKSEESEEIFNGFQSNSNRSFIREQTPQAGRKCFRNVDNEQLALSIRSYWTETPCSTGSKLSTISNPAYSEFAKGGWRLLKDYKNLCETFNFQKETCVSFDKKLTSATIQIECKRTRAATNFTQTTHRERQEYKCSVWKNRAVIKILSLIKCRAPVLDQIMMFLQNMPRLSYSSSWKSAPATYLKLHFKLFGFQIQFLIPMGLWDTEKEYF